MEDSLINRLRVEQVEEWREWIEKIPYIDFPPEWRVKVIPPFAGAMVRFLVTLKDDANEKNRISVYLDCHSHLGYFGDNTPYWEIYPYENDTYRVAMNDAEELIERISEALKESDGKEIE